VDFQGEYYWLNDAILLPRPARPGGPPILVGGNGRKRTLPLAARYAAEWNAVYLTPEEFARSNALLDDALRERGRPLESVRRSMMVGCVFGRDDAAVRRKVRDRTSGRSTPEELRRKGVVTGGVSEFVDQIQKLSEAGVQRVMLQWLELTQSTIWKRWQPGYCCALRLDRFLS
jgi:alkanesulfonate monooxygenase SsuD/methylene tetrahydromethanopterin reductase-like flavin-dependent oxidoreductase (luciferase family)